MKLNKIFSSIVIAGMVLGSFQSYAGSIGRSGGGSSSSSSRSSSSYSSPSKSYSAPAPSRPAQAAPAAPGGIGGTSGSMGVRKSTVTQPVANQVQAGKPAPAAAPGAPTGGSSTGSYSAPAPVYSQPSTSGVFMGALGGSLVGNMLGNSLFGNHGGYNNGGYNNGNGYAPNVQAQQGGQSGVAQVVVQKSYGVGDFIIDVILFALLVGLLVGLAFLAYKGYKMIRNYVNRERGVVQAQPFSPTAQFWMIQKLFAAADVTALTALLGPDLVDEATANLTPSTLTLNKVSHEVVLNNPREFSVHYTFDDAGVTVDQVWHYELHDGSWKLNGIETV